MKLFVRPVKPGGEPVTGGESTIDVADFGPQPVLVDEQPVQVDLVAIQSGLYSVRLGPRSYEVVIDQIGPAAAGSVTASVDGAAFALQIEDARQRARRQAERQQSSRADPQQATVAAPMPGRVVSVPVQQGQIVERGQTIAVLEAMKMESALAAPIGGTVVAVLVEPGQTVSQRQPVVRIEG